jgi:hypothetical protein
MSDRSYFHSQGRSFTLEFLAYGRKFKGSASIIFQVKITHFAGAFAIISTLQLSALRGVVL